MSKNYSIELLQKELSKLERSFKKSREYLCLDKITVSEHLVHRDNLNPKIINLKNSIYKLSQ